jgi:ricin-type beta-trefoil lectin protein
MTTSRRRLVALIVLVVLALIPVGPASAQEQAEPPDVDDPTAGEAPDDYVEPADDPNWRIWGRPDAGSAYACMHADFPEVGQDAQTYRYGGPCEYRAQEIWEFHFVRPAPSGTALYWIQFPYANPDLCLSVEGVETLRTLDGDDAQLEPCENGDDALWYFWRWDGTHLRMRNYNVPGADRCLQVDPRDDFYDVTVQLWTCDGNAPSQDFYRTAA